MRRRDVLLVSFGEAFIVSVAVFLARLYDHWECSVLASVRVSRGGAAGGVGLRSSVSAWVVIDG